MAGQAHSLQPFLKTPPRRTHTERETPIPIKTLPRRTHTIKEAPIPNEVQLITPANHTISTAAKASSRWKMTYLSHASISRLPPHPRPRPSLLPSLYPCNRLWITKSRYGRESAPRHPSDTRSTKTRRRESRTGLKRHGSSCVNSRRPWIELRLNLKRFRPWQRRSLSVFPSP